MRPPRTAALAIVHACWWDGRPGEYGIHYSRSTNNGATWNTERYLTDTTYGSDYPTIAAAGGNVYLAFRTWPGGHFFISYSSSTDNGETWSAETALTTADGMGTAALAAAGARTDLILYDNRDGNHEIYYKRNVTAGGVEETSNAEVPMPNSASIIHSVLLLPRSLDPSIPRSLLDISGRKVLDLTPGSNDVSRLAPGVYFVRALNCELSAVSCHKVVVQR